MLVAAGLTTGNDLNALIICKCQMLPSIAVVKVEKNREDAENLNSNLIIKKTAARVNPSKLVSAPANQIPTPCIVFQDTQKSLNNGLFGMQTGDKFIDQFKNLLAFLLVIDWNIVKLKLCQKGFDFALIIGDSDQLHHKTKHMELNTRLPTQHVTTKTVLKANNTLFDNLAFKFTLKARGINRGLGSDPALVSKLQNRDLLKSLMQNALFFDIDLSHHVLYKGQANISKGDFGYQTPQKTIVNAALLEAKFDAAINAYYRYSGRYPSWIVVYRSAEVDKVQE
uniref:Uncharacterized protein n=1 Tax=Panagrolaimus sp. PS1159 TaxID=55785 RepID=A0AC35F8G5_9BILA